MEGKPQFDALDAFGLYAPLRAANQAPVSCRTAQAAWVETQFQDYYGSGLISGAMPSLSLSVRPHRCATVRHAAFGGSAGSCRQQGSSWVAPFDCHSRETLSCMPLAQL
jgi:hypothetical protein